MLVVELLDVQEESLDAPELLPLSPIWSCYRFLHYIASLKGTITKPFVKERSQTYASKSQRFVTITFL